jgi:hypothetical protein
VFVAPGFTAHAPSPFARADAGASIEHLRRAVEFCQCASIVTSLLAGAFYGSLKQPVAPISKQKVTDASPTRRGGALRMTLSSSAKDRPIALHPTRLFPFGNERRLHRSVF